ncbi:Uma2 family endonuclease [Paenibacillus sp. MER 180]|uniref:Uma2 family endonuclease n=1 Tax=Paenibacillus sp. MER 180 TaxID=2939570 RepID=UPI002559A694
MARRLRGVTRPDENCTYSYQDWLTWEGAWELIHGKAYNMTPSPNSTHQFIVGELYYALRSFFQNRKCYVFVAPLDVMFSEHLDYDSPEHVVQPDISVVCAKEQVSKQGCHGAPSLLVEVLSPSTALKDFNEKFNLYQKYGVQEYWIVDPGNRTVHVNTLQEGVYSIRSTYTEQDIVQSILFRELQIPLHQLFSI